MLEVGQLWKCKSDARVGRVEKLDTGFSPTVHIAIESGRPRGGKHKTRVYRGDFVKDWKRVVETPKPESPVVDPASVITRAQIVTTDQALKILMDAGYHVVLMPAKTIAQHVADSNAELARCVAAGGKVMDKVRVHALRDATGTLNLYIDPKHVGPNKIKTIKLMRETCDDTGSRLDLKAAIDMANGLIDLPFAMHVTKERSDDAIRSFAAIGATVFAR